MAIERTLAVQIQTTSENRLYESSSVLIILFSTSYGDDNSARRFTVWPLTLDCLAIDHHGDDHVMSPFFLFNADSSHYEYLIKLDTIYLKLFGKYIIWMSLCTKFVYSERFYNASSKIDFWKSWRFVRLVTHQRMDDTISKLHILLTEAVARQISSRGNAATWFRCERV